MQHSPRDPLPGDDTFANHQLVGVVLSKDDRVLVFVRILRQRWGSGHNN